MYLARTMTPRSYPEIGKCMERDHTTVMHGYERIRDRRLVEPDLDAEIEAIKRSIRDDTNDPGNNTSIK
jgi:chromosomal replication initiator protein